MVFSARRRQALLAAPSSGGSSQWQDKRAGIHGLPFMPARYLATKAILLLLLCLLSLTAAAQEPIAEIREGFEDSASGNLPGKWTIGPAGAYTADVVQQDVHEGRQAVRVRSVGLRQRRDFGNLAHARIDATPYRGQRVLYRAWVRADVNSSNSGAGLWLRVDRPNRQIASLQNMQGRKITASNWQAFELIADIPRDADSLRFGMLLYGEGEAWLDAASLRVLGKTIKRPHEPPRALTERGTENLVALARLLGYIRYFYPSDAAASIDWDRFAVASVRRVEAAGDVDELRTILLEQFLSVAPTLELIAGSDSREPAPAPRPLIAGGTRRVRWVHHSVSSPHPLSNSVYRSEREWTSIAPDGAGVGALDPAWPLRKQVAPGLTAWLHTVLYADRAGTLPHVVPPPNTASAALGGGEGSFSADDRATRLANVILAWNVFQHFYPYFDVVEVDWQEELRRALTEAATKAGECNHLLTLRRMVAALGDGHGDVSHLCETGLRVPPVTLAWVEDSPVVTFVQDGLAGIRAGDRILRVDGRPAEEVLNEKIPFISAATPQSRYYRGMQELLEGPSNSVVELLVEHISGHTAAVRLSRTTPSYETLEQRPSMIAELRPGIWYIDLDRISTEQWTSVIPTLRGARGILFDLRGYPRNVSVSSVLPHLASIPLSSPQFHLPIVTRPDREELRFQHRPTYTMSPREPYLLAPKIFLTDGRAISAAEWFLGIVEHFELGEIVGGATAGTNGNINPFHLPGGYEVVWTGARVLKHDGSRHHGIGILPTIPVQRTREGIAAGRDELLERALELLER